jgi:protocatechuate 3,4-dioxygenase beta subunit
MSRSSRRDFLKRTSIGLAAIGASGLSLRAGAEPTPADGTFQEHRHVLETTASPRRRQPAPSDDWKVTPSDMLGPFYQEGAPFRGKVTPPLEAGDTLAITGRVWDYDSREPLSGVVLDLWQADIRGEYEDAEENVRLRTRLTTDEEGYYEYETIYPGRYGTRPAHIHYMVRHPRYSKLVTQLYFRGDENNENEKIEEALITDLEEVEGTGGTYRRGVFDIVLTPKES